MVLRTMKKVSTLRANRRTSLFAHRFQNNFLICYKLNYDGYRDLSLPLNCTDPNNPSVTPLTPGPQSEISPQTKRLLFNALCSVSGEVEEPNLGIFHTDRMKSLFQFYFFSPFLSTYGC